ncbi:hypothetical protein EGI26_07330 [Lacihabitans sp. CCS-44]|nr:hypothetical protein [Lacihabitans sp. CCS-44]
MRSKQYGLVPFKSGIGYLNLNIHQEYDSLFTIEKRLKRFGYGYGLEMHTNLGKVNQFLLPIGYVKIRYGAFELYGGRRREIQGLVDTLGTMGSYIWSGNALPMPKIEIAIPNYTPIMKNGLIAIKGNFAHGWFGKGDAVQNVWLHQKSFYARIGKPAWKVQLQGGFNHQVQWGGYPTKPFYDELSKKTITRFSTDFSTFIKVATGVSLNNKGQGLNTNSPANDALNRAGNHLGSVDIGLDLKLTNNYNILVYRQSFYEDGSLFYLNNIADGLFGITLNNNLGKIKKIIFEYFNSKSQGGEVYENLPELRGMDNYFNNGTYLDSWTYKSSIIGTPLILTNSSNKNHQTNDINYVFNNRITALNIGIGYNILSFENFTQILKSKHFGNYSYPLKLSQTSISHTINKKVMSSIFNGKIALDLGEFWTKQIGIQLGLIIPIK